MTGYTRNVLVVEPNPVERDRMAAALEGDGFQVMLCTGPTEPDYSCVGARTGTCPLATENSVVVLDMDLDSEAVMMGTPAEDLLAMYLGSGHPVVALDRRPREEVPGQLLGLRRHPETPALLAAVWRLAAPHGTLPSPRPDADLDPRP